MHWKAFLPLGKIGVWAVNFYCFFEKYFPTRAVLDDYDKRLKYALKDVNFSPKYDIMEWKLGVRVVHSVWSLPRGRGSMHETSAEGCRKNIQKVFHVWSSFGENIWFFVQAPSRTLPFFLVPPLIHLAAYIVSSAKMNGGKRPSLS